jgi:hypothetical protein
MTSACWPERLARWPFITNRRNLPDRKEENDDRAMPMQRIPRRNSKGPGFESTALMRRPFAGPAIFSAFSGQRLSRGKYVIAPYPALPKARHEHPPEDRFRL